MDKRWWPNGLVVLFFVGISTTAGAQALQPGELVTTSWETEPTRWMIMRVDPATGDVAEIVVNVDPDDDDITFPQRGITAIDVTPDGRVVVAEYHGLHVLDPDNGNVTNLIRWDPTCSHTEFRVSEVAVENNNTALVAAEEANYSQCVEQSKKTGVWRVNLANGQRQTVSVDGELIGDGMMEVDAEGTIWWLNGHGPLIKVNPATGAQDEIADLGGSGIESRSLYALEIDGQGNVLALADPVWQGQVTELYHVDTSTEVVTSLPVDPTFPQPSGPASGLSWGSKMHMETDLGGSILLSGIAGDEADIIRIVPGGAGLSYAPVAKDPDAMYQRLSVYGDVDTTPGQCEDGVDNDADGQTDGADSGCASPYHLTEEPQCSDGVDNDGDGLSDMDDELCASPSDDAEFGECNDGIDNDGDGFTDYLDDEKCQGLNDPTEVPVPPTCGISRAGADGSPVLVVIALIGLALRRPRVRRPQIA